MNCHIKILWVCNTPNADVCEYKNKDAFYQGGWLTGMSRMFQDISAVKLVYCYPVIGQKVQDNFIYKNIHYYSFYTSPKYGFLSIDADKNDSLKYIHLKRIIDTEKPDIIHIWGTEYRHACITAEIVEDKSKLICSIQGLTSIYERHFLSFVPYRIGKSYNISCIFRRNLIGQQKQLRARGKNEIKTLRLCKNVIGRTEWDEACTYFVNPQRIYYKCNETLRNSFYEAEWKYEKCIKNSIFISQASSPIKGLNMLLEAVYLLKNEFTDITLKIAGNNFVKSGTVMEMLKRSTYGAYIAKLINKFQLEKNVIFLGVLNEKQMVTEYLKCNVFVSSSSIENSSNSIGEAMILGLPVVSSDVGGVKSLLLDGQEGFLYQGDAPYMLAMKLRNIFQNPETGKTLGRNARKRALQTHDPLKNRDALMDIYKEVIEKHVMD